MQAKKYESSVSTKKKNHAFLCIEQITLQFVFDLQRNTCSVLLKSNYQLISNKTFLFKQTFACNYMQQD